jgi:antitoxin YefM
VSIYRHEEGIAVPEVLNITSARRIIGDVVTDAVVHHRPVPIERNRRDQALVLGRDDILRLVAEHEFHPEVFSEEGAVSVWLPEFALYGRGGSFPEAQEDLLDEVRLYVDDYIERADEFLRAPNRAHHYPWVLRALIAELRDELAEVLFAEPSAAASGSG